MSSSQIIEHKHNNKSGICKEFLEYKVGDTLKQLRLSNNMTQKHVAREIGLSSGMISLIESNSISASITTLSKLMKFYRLNMSWLFNDKNDKMKYEVIRKDERKLVSRILTQNGACNGKGFNCESLSPMKLKKMQPYIITLSDGIIGDNFYIHYGESFLYVLKGVFELTLGGLQEVLREGDSVYLDASLEHRFRSRDGSEVTILVVKMAVV